MRHNKKRNSGVLCQIMIAGMAKYPEKAAEIMQLLESNFNRKTTPLGAEFAIYQELMGAISRGGVTERAAAKLIETAKVHRQAIDSKKLNEQKTQLINSVNRALGQDIWSEFVEGYRNYAQIYQILQPDDSMTMTDRILAEEAYIADCVASQGEMITEGVSMNTMTSIALKKFESYKQDMDPAQYHLLECFIEAPKDGGAAFKLYANEELARVRKVITEAAIDATPQLAVDLRDAVRILEDFKVRPLTTEDIPTIMRLQNVAKVVQANGQG